MVYKAAVKFQGEEMAMMCSQAGSGIEGRASIVIIST